MDECVGSVMPLYAFLAEFVNRDGPNVLPTMRALLIHSELSGKTWLLRPAMVHLLLRLFEAQKAKQIVGVFLFSNNGSGSLVTFIRYLLNGLVAFLTDDEEGENLILMSVHAHHESRPANYVKSYEVIQGSLAAHGLPTLASPHDLLFYDDMAHVLKDETPHYVQVRAYKNITPVPNLVEVFAFFNNYLGTDVYESIVNMALRDQTKDRSEYPDQVFQPPTLEETQTDFLQMDAALRHFLQSKPPRKRPRMIPASPRKIKRKSRSPTMNMIRSPPQPAPLSSSNAYTTWPGGVDPTARLFNTDNQGYTAKGGKRSRRRSTRRRRAQHKKRRNTRRH